METKKETKEIKEIKEAEQMVEGTVLELGKDSVELKEDVDVQEEEEFNINRLVLSFPFDYEGKHYEVLDLNFDRLTGAAVTKAERKFRLEVPDHNSIQNVILSPTYWQILGSMAAGIPYEVVAAMNMKDSIELVGHLKVFFNE